MQASEWEKKKSQSTWAESARDWAQVNDLGAAVHCGIPLGRVAHVRGGRQAVVGASDVILPRATIHNVLNARAYKQNNQYIVILVCIFNLIFVHLFVHWFAHYFDHLFILSFVCLLFDHRFIFSSIVLLIHLFV